MGRSEGPINPIPTPPPRPRWGDVPQFTVSPDQPVSFFDQVVLRFNQPCVRESPRTVRMCIPHITENVAEFIARHAKDGANICLESEMVAGCLGSCSTTIRAMYPHGTEMMKSSDLGWTLTWDTPTFFSTGNLYPKE